MQRGIGDRVVSALIAFALGMGVFTVSAHASSPMETGKRTTQPIGHYEFCKSNPGECSIRTRNPMPETMTDALWRKIVSVNTSVNNAVKPVSDIDLYGVEEFWTLPVNGAGDCEEYVLEKQRELRNAGLAVSNLLITVLRRSNGEGHAVLTVRTDKGDYVLDNLGNQVVPWYRTGYSFLRMQNPAAPQKWDAIAAGGIFSVTASIGGS